jgi:hypothetical protein
MFLDTTDQLDMSIKADESHSDPAEGNVKLPKILLNGNNICMVLIGFHKSNGFADKIADGSWRRRPNSP